MMNFLTILHSWFRWLILIAAIWTIIRAISGLAGHKNYLKGDRTSSLLFMIFMDIQFLIGLVLYFLGGWAKNWSGDIAAMMKNSAVRFFTMEHVLMMIIALVLVHIGNTSVKKASVARKKHGRTLLFFGLAFIVILAAIPWPFREGLGVHTWFSF